MPGTCYSIPHRRHHHDWFDYHTGRQKSILEGKFCAVLVPVSLLTSLASSHSFSSVQPTPFSWTISRLYWITSPSLLFRDAALVEPSTTLDPCLIVVPSTLGTRHCREAAVNGLLICQAWRFRRYTAGTHGLADTLLPVPASSSTTSSLDPKVNGKNSL